MSNSLFWPLKCRFWPFTPTFLLICRLLSLIYGIFNHFIIFFFYLTIGSFVDSIDVQKDSSNSYQKLGGLLAQNFGVWPWPPPAHLTSLSVPCGNRSLLENYCRFQTDLPFTKILIVFLKITSLSGDGLSASCMACASYKHGSDFGHWDL